VFKRVCVRSRLGLCAGLTMVLLACTSVPPAAPALPVLRLAPQSLGRNLDVQQQLHIQVADQAERQLEAVLEADATGVRLGLLSMGQTVARLEWDGQQLREHRAPWLPAAVSGERVLSDLQWVYWPLPAIAAYLPAGWGVAEAAGVRRVHWGDELVLSVTPLSPGVVEFHNHRDRYRLRIHSLNLGAAQ
jgi:hypothetical protein